MRALAYIFIFISSLLSAQDKIPVGNYVSSGGVVDLVYKDSKIYSATTASCVDIFDYDTKTLIQKIQVGQIEDFMGDLVDSKVYSVDISDDNILILSQDKKGFRRVHLHKNGKTELLFDHTHSLAVAKAKFLNNGTILLGLLSNELISYDIDKKKKNWVVQVSQAKFSDFVLNESKTEAVVADESGNLKIYSTKDGKRINILEGQNLDNVFQVDYKSGVIATAGQDRRMVVYTPKMNSSYYVESDFLIYSVGLSPNAAYAAYACDEDNNICVVKTSTKSRVGKFGSNNMTLTKILFINNNEFLAASDDKVINLYSIK